MPSWLLTALLIVLIIWTVIEVTAWGCIIYAYHKITPWERKKITFHAPGLWLTFLTIVAWVFVISYWLR